MDRVIVKKLLRKDSKTSGYRVDPFSMEEIALILAASQGQAKNLFQFAFNTGLRTKELIALQWSDIDFKNGSVRVHCWFSYKASK